MGTGYRGYVDQITREGISGWAADLRSPDQAMDVIILVNGDKIARVSCDMLRDDLKKLGIYGSGKHGFSYKFSPPLDEARSWGIAVRFADTGRPLGVGDAVLQQAPETRSALVPPASLSLPAPTDPASLFRFLALHEDDEGLFKLLCRLDFAGVRPGDLEHSVFGNHGNAQVAPGEWTQHAARDYLDTLLASAAFQKDLIAYVLRALPEKRRLFFVHIPKCAGTDLVHHLATRFPVIPAFWQEASWTPRPHLFRNLARFIRDTWFFDSVVVAGHVPLSYYAEWNLLRRGDEVFTVVRDPSEIAVSTLNYLFTRIQAAVRHGEIQPDLAEWMALLDLREPPPEVAPDFVAEIAQRALHVPEIVSPNPLCSWLGGGSAEAVVSRLAEHRVEVTTTVKYDDWLASKWGITFSARANVSAKYVSSSALSKADMEFLRSRSAEDRKLYDLIVAAIEHSGGSSIFGDDLLRQARP